MSPLMPSLSLPIISCNNYVATRHLTVKAYVDSSTDNSGGKPKPTKLEIAGMKFTGGTGNGGGGGSIYISSASEIIVKQMIFDKNSANENNQNGGTILATQGSSVKLLETIISDSSTSGNGGGGVVGTNPGTYNLSRSPICKIAAGFNFRLSLTTRSSRMYCTILVREYAGNLFAK